MPKWAQDGTQVVTPPDAKIERGFTRGQGVSVGHLNYALSLEGSNFYDPYPNVFQAVAGDLTATHSGTPLLPGVRFGYDSTSGGFDFFAVVTYTAGTADNPSGTLSTPILYRTGVLGGDTIAVDADNITAAFGTNGLYLDGPTTSFNSQNTLLLSRTSLTGGSLSATHGFEAGSKRVNTADNAADKRRYAYPSTDKLSVSVNCGFTVGYNSWTKVTNNGGGSGTTHQKLAIDDTASANNYILCATTGTSGLPGLFRRPLFEFLHNTEAGSSPIMTLTGIRYEVTVGVGSTVKVRLMSAPLFPGTGTDVIWSVEATLSSTTASSSLVVEEKTKQDYSVQLANTSKQYAIEVVIVNSSATTSGALVAGLRDIQLTFAKSAVE